jgi:hypothetical protein
VEEAYKLALADTGLVDNGAAGEGGQIVRLASKQRIESEFVPWADSVVAGTG